MGPPSPFNNPTLRDDLPRYPPLIQLIRVTSMVVPGPAGVAQVAGSSILAPILYVSFTEQMRTDSLLPRDREPCLAADVNGLGLSPGFYLGRLSGSWTSLPVYEIIGVAPDSFSGHWVQITEVSGLKAAGIEVTPKGGGAYLETPGGYIHTLISQPLYEVNDLAGAPVGSVVWVRRGGLGGQGREWIYEWGWIPGIIVSHDAVAGIYTVLEREITLGSWGPKVDARTFTMVRERNNFTVPTGSKVRLFRGSGLLGAIEELWFDYESGGGNQTFVSNEPVYNLVPDPTEGAIYNVMNPSTFATKGYQYLCFTGYSCAWFDLCTCSWVSGSPTVVTPPPDPPEPCCDGMGDMFGTFVNVSGCVCAESDGISITSPDGTTFVGSTTANFCGGMRQLNIDGYCDGTTVEDMKIDWEFTDAMDPGCEGQAGTASVLLDPAPSCDPVSLWFEITFASECCGGVGGTSTIRIHVTE